MVKKMIAMTTCCLLLTVMGGCASSKNVLHTVTEKVKGLQQKKDPPPSIQKKTKSPGYTYWKNPRNSFCQAYLSQEWNNNAFKFISIDGLRYSHGMIINYVNDPKNDSMFFLKKDEGLGVELNEHFDIEIAFYPPNKKDHEEFKPFKVIVIRKDNVIIQSKTIISRMKRFRMTR
jgi:hypothetical protein